MSEESNKQAGVDIDLWKKVIEQSKDKEPCCDENNPCCCHTFSPYMASPDDVKKFLEVQEKLKDKETWFPKMVERAKRLFDRLPSKNNEI